MSPLRILVVLGASALVLAGVAGAEGPQLNGTTGPGYSIVLKDASGADVTHLDPGPFSLTVDDTSEDHDFHLTGPGVDVATDIETTGKKTFAVTLTDGKYTFFCDAHPGRMSHSFGVGTAPPELPPTKPPATKPPPRVVLTLTGKAVTLTTAAGKAVKTLPATLVVITARDRSATRGIRLTGAGVKRSTGVPFVGTVTWRVKLAAGKLVYGSDLGKPVLRAGRVTVS